MAVKVKYVPLPSESGEEKPKGNEWMAELVSVMEKEIRENAGFLKLQDLKTDEIYFYNHKICGILGDISSDNLEQQLEEGDIIYSGEVLSTVNRTLAEKIGHLQDAGIINQIEYQTLFQSKDYDELCKKRGWRNIKEVPVMTVEPVTIFKSSGGSKVYGVPVFRCEERGWGISPGTNMIDLAICLIQQELLPAVILELEESLYKDILSCVRGNDTDTEQNKELRIIFEDQDELEKVKKYYREKDKEAVNLPEYDDTIFQKARGCWDLYSFAGLKEEEDLKSRGGTWYKDGELYARNPVEDAAPGAVWAAIDFGTKSTVAAVFDEGGDITMIPVGEMSKEAAAEEEAFENPTIMKFCEDIMRFVKAYEKTEYRPDTKFADVSVSHPALLDYEQKSKDKNMYQYLNHLKQWVNQPGSILEAVDLKGQEIKLKCDSFGQMEGALDPIEIYAYYVGRNINNMHQGRIYLKYLLSYSSTYIVQSREKIRASFERGLRKSLPSQVGTDEKLMKKFEVRLWRDEASAYAISAISKYLEEEYQKGENDENVFKQALKEGGIFYGTYDFGGGTLDFSFGKMQQKGEKDVYRLLKCGGSSILGCENILEDLAYQIFSREENSRTLIAKGMKCEKPFVCGKRQDDYLLAGHSNAARLNTCGLIEYLRGYWLDKKNRKPFILQDENGKEYDAELAETISDPKADDKKIKLQMKEEDIEDFFCGQVKEGIRLFIRYYAEVCGDYKEMEKEKCFIFLAGNASRAGRVKKCFDDLLGSSGLKERFHICDPLPTKSDEEQRQKHPGQSIPTAKSGVVYGMLLSRPGAEYIEVRDELPGVTFLYHIGKRERDRANIAKGKFQLRMHANQVPSSRQGYRNLMKITQQDFELLYTSDGGYALQEPQPVGDTVSVMAIHVPEEYKEYFLYAQAEAGSTDTLLLGVSKEEGEYQSKVEKIIGVCDFKSGEFEVYENSRQNAKSQEPLNKSFYITIRDQFGNEFQEQMQTETEIKKLLFETDSDCLEFYAGKSSEMVQKEFLNIELGSPGRKQILLVKKAGIQLNLGYKTEHGEVKIFHINLDTNEIIN